MLADSLNVLLGYFGVSLGLQVNATCIRICTDRVKEI